MGAGELEPADWSHKIHKRRSEQWLLLVVIIVGVAIRVAPNISYWIWGNDFGIYYYLSRSYVSLNSWIAPPSSPWGIDGYQYFPVTYAIVDAVSSLTGLPVLTSLKYVIPLLGGLTPFLLYCISRELQISRSISFLSAIFLAVDPIQLFQTSQANYLTTGHFFLLLSVLLFIKYHSKLGYFVPAIISSTVLTLTHQLSSYIFLISLIGMIVSVQLYNGLWRRYLRLDIIYTTFTGTFLLGYLILRVPTSRYFLVSAADGLALMWITLSFYTVVITAYSLLRRNGSCCILWKVMEKLRKNGSTRKNFKELVLLTLAVAVIEISLTILIFTGRYSFISYDSVFLSLPFAIFLGISVLGTKNSLINGEAPAAIGWAIAITVSMTYSAVTSNKTLEVARQVEYLVEPFSIIAGMALYDWLHVPYETESTRYRPLPMLDLIKDIKISGTKPDGRWNVNENSHQSSPFPYNTCLHAWHGRRGIIAVALVSVLFVSLVATSYSMPSLFVPSINEGATSQDAAAIAYLNSYGNRNLSVATDHQLGIMLYSYGFISPFDKISLLWSSDNWEKAFWELEGGNGSYPRIGYILLDTAMITDGIWGFNGVNNPSQPPIYMSNASFNKFFQEPFKLVFKDSSGDNRFTAYVFAVNMSYIDEFCNSTNPGGSAHYANSTILYEHPFDRPSTGIPGWIDAWPEANNLLDLSQYAWNSVTLAPFSYQNGRMLPQIFHSFLNFQFSFVTHFD